MLRLPYVRHVTFGARLAPPKLARCSRTLAKAEHAEHVPDPPRSALDDGDVKLRARAPGDVDIDLAHELAEYGDRLGRVERVAQCRAERGLRGVQPGGAA
jgi:hypothetical protein